VRWYPARPSADPVLPLVSLIPKLRGTPQPGEGGGYPPLMLMLVLVLVLVLDLRQHLWR
jgi:hypothetical protein